MEPSEPVEDAPESVTVKVTMRDGMMRLMRVDNHTVETMHNEIDDGFVQNTYIMFELSDHQRVYLNPREVAGIEVHTGGWAEHD